MKKLNAVWLMLLILVLGSTVVLAGTLEEALAIEDRNERRNAVMELAIGPGLTDQQVIEVARILRPAHANRINRRRSWESDENSKLFRVTYAKARADQGDVTPSRHYRNWFRQWIQSLDTEQAVAELESAIRALLLREPSTHRDDWIRELRA